MNFVLINKDHTIHFEHIRQDSAAYTIVSYLQTYYPSIIDVISERIGSSTIVTLNGVNKLAKLLECDNIDCRTEQDYANSIIRWVEDHPELVKFRMIL